MTMRGELNSKVKGQGYNVTSVWRVFTHNSTKELQILAAAATQQIKIKMITIFYKNYVIYIYLYFASEAATYINVQTQIKNHKRQLYYIATYCIKYTDI